jgi:hypothetical protein
MTQTKNTELKQEIITVVRKSGIPIRRQRIANRVAVPEGVDLGELLGELVAEGRLTRRHTLLSNGEVTYIYNLRATS